MKIYQGIQLVYAHVVQFIQSIGNWFENINWSAITDCYPIQFRGVISAMLIIVLAMAAVGITKKLSFLLG